MKIALFAALVCLAVALPSRQVQNLNNPARIRGEFLVVLHPNAGRSTNAQYASSIAAKIAGISKKISIIKTFDALRAPIIHVMSTDESVMSQLYNLQEVEVVESNLYENMISQCSSQNTGEELWGLSRTSARDQPDYASAAYSYSSSDGFGVRVYVIDTSIRITHQDFGQRAVFGANFAGGNDGDGNGHGTHCAGTVGGTTYGVSKGATLVAIKVLNDFGFGSTDDIVDGINWMVEDVANNGWRGVGSMSLGGGANLAMDSAVNSADAAGVPVVVAAGNSNSDACNTSPARASGAITIASTDISDTLSSFSSWGPCTNILAPGSNILSASHTSDTGSVVFSGTSMACPHVAGLVATYLADNPNALPSEVKGYLDSSSTAGAINLRGVPDTPNLLLYSSCT